MISIWFLILLLIQAREPRIGDPGWRFDESRFDPRYPAMREWAKAGVEGGIPLRNALRIRERLKPGDKLQAAIDRTAAAGGGVVLLEPGEHPVTETIRLRSRVVLRGADNERSIISVRMKAPFFRVSGGKQATAIEVVDAERVGFEDLTIRYDAVDFEPYDKDDFSAAWDRRVFHEDEARDDQLFVHLLIFTRTRNSWVDNCRLLNAGAHPVGLSSCTHMTMRDNFIDRAYVKKDSMHGGYYGVWGSSYCLFYNEKVRRIRHFALMLPGCRYNVVYDCDFEVDVNFHDADDGDNLVERSRIATPVWHSWDAIGIGAKGKHRPPGPGNLLFSNRPVSKGIGGYNRRIKMEGDDAVYQVTTEFGRPAVSVLSRVSPNGGTLYAVKRQR